MADNGIGYKEMRQFVLTLLDTVNGLTEGPWKRSSLFQDRQPYEVWQMVSKKSVGDFGDVHLVGGAFVDVDGVTIRYIFEMMFTNTVTKTQVEEAFGPILDAAEEQQFELWWNHPGLPIRNEDEPYAFPVAA